MGRHVRKCGRSLRAMPEIGNRVPKHQLFSDGNSRRHGGSRRCMSNEKGAMSRMPNVGYMGNIARPPDSELRQC